MKSADLILIEKSGNEPIPYSLLLLADASIHAIDKYIHKCTIYLITSGNNTLGVCAIQEVDANTIEIKNLAVSEEFRNCGVGSCCLQKIEAIYPLKNILVGTGDGSLDALRFYKKNGFEALAIRKNFFLNNYHNPIVENGMQLRDQIVLRKTRIQSADLP
jgi:aminoglycoside 6'-N-acetyltransferase I